MDSALATGAHDMSGKHRLEVEHPWINATVLLMRDKSWELAGDVFKIEKGYW